MTDRLVRSGADMVSMWGARIAELGLSNLQVDLLANQPLGYCNKILNLKKRPGAKTIERMNHALALAFKPVVDPEREQIMREEWEKRQR
jgi:hypothetical protein